MSISSVLPTVPCETLTPRISGVFRYWHTWLCRSPARCWHTRIVRVFYSDSRSRWSGQSLWRHLRAGSSNRWRLCGGVLCRWCRVAPRGRPRDTWEGSQGRTLVDTSPPSNSTVVNEKKSFWKKYIKRVGQLGEKRVPDVAPRDTSSVLCLDSGVDPHWININGPIVVSGLENTQWGQIIPKRPHHIPHCDRFYPDISTSPRWWCRFCCHRCKPIVSAKKCLNRAWQRSGVFTIFR